MVADASQVDEAQPESWDPFWELVFGTGDRTKSGKRTKEQNEANGGDDADGIGGGATVPSPRLCAITRALRHSTCAR